MQNPKGLHELIEQSYDLYFEVGLSGYNREMRYSVELDNGNLLWSY